MSKIGILTYHFLCNFGATLQSYALYQLIKEKKYEVEFIDYQPKQLQTEEFKYLYLNKGFLPNPGLISGVIKSIKARNFLASKMDLSKNKYYTRQELYNSEHKYNAVICGSDEIWNINSCMGFNPSYLFDFIYNPEISKISYAPSFGSTKTLGNYKESIAKSLQEFHSISVRDNNSLNLVNQCNVKAVKVLDPTFLADFTKIIKIPKIRNEYILVYGSLTIPEGEYIQSVADSEGLDIIAIGARAGKWKPPINLVGISPEEWLGYFSRASYVFTTFYHGVVFSIIFRKSFTNFERMEKSVKVKDLLGDIGLNNRIINNDSIFDLKPKLSNISWDNEKIEQLIKNSKQYLYKALEN